MATTSQSKVIIHMVASLDGFIAKKDNSISWLESSDYYEKGVVLSDEEVAAFLETIDCYVIGAKTYEHALNLGWPYGDVPVIVVTKRALKSERKTVRFYSGELTTLVHDDLKPKYTKIWLAGGAILTKAFLRLKLADELIISMMPVILGDGTLFFDYIGQEQKLHLKDVKAYKNGMVELWYEILTH
ncbi:MAG: dihydrofolate reductase family protein [Bacteroidota bacterium]